MAVQGLCAELCQSRLGLSPASFLLLPTLGRDKNKGSARGGDSLVRGVLKHTSSNWVEDCGRMPQKMGPKAVRCSALRGVSEESGAKVASPSRKHQLCNKQASACNKHHQQDDQHGLTYQLNFKLKSDTFF